MTITKNGFTFIRDITRSASWQVFFDGKFFTRASTATVVKCLAV